MIQGVKIHNFRSLRSVEVPLRPLTVLIGPNDSGKSSFLKALNGVVNGEKISIEDRWRNDSGEVTTVVADIPNGQGRISTVSPKVIGQFGALQPVGMFYFPSQGVVMNSPGQHETHGPPSIGPNGENVPTLFDYLLRQDRRRFFSTVEAIRSLVPGLEDINVATPKPDVRRLDLVIENGFRLPADRASTGVRLLLAFVALAYHPSPPGLILLEEPENGIHPKRLADVLRLLREITKGKHGEKAAQVVLTTHSPYLLDLVNPNEEQVLVFRRLEDGSRTAEAADTERLGLFLDEFMLGEVWYNQGEEGLVPSRR